MAKNVSVERLHDLFEYDPLTGLITRKCRPTNSVHEGDVAGWIDEKGYNRICVDRAYLYAHRIAYAMHFGKWPKKNIDHINRIRTDNRISNLREACQSQNTMNGNMRKNNTSGTTGVVWDKKRQRWCAQICVHGKNIVLGRFKDKGHAVDARKKGEHRYFGEFAPMEALTQQANERNERKGYAA